MYAVSKPRMQDPTSVVTLHSPDANSFSLCTLRVSDDSVSNDYFHCPSMRLNPSPQAFAYSSVLYVAVVID